MDAREAMTAGGAAARDRRVAAAAMLAALVWGVGVRLPFVPRPTIDADAALFWIAGDGWRRGLMPYAAVWDVKPPGVFLLFAGVAALFGGDPAGARLLAAGAVGVAAAGLVAAGARLFGTLRAGIVAAALFAPATLLLEGLACRPELLAAPFVVWGIVLALAPGGGVGAAVAGGALLGVAATIKQTAGFEALFVLAALAAARRPVAGVVAGLVAAPLAFALWFAAHGLLPALADAALVAAVARLHGDGGTVAGGPLRLLAALKPVLPLLAGVGLFAAERRAVATVARAPALLWGWLGAAAAAALAMRVAYRTYTLPLLAPMALATGLAVAALAAGGRARRAAAAGVVAVALLSVPVAWRLCPDDVATDPAVAVVAADAARLARGRPIYVVDYDPTVYQLAGAPVPTRFPLPQHLVCDFPALPVPAAAEMRRIVAGRPAVLVVSTDHRRMACERPERVDDAMRQAIALGYRRDRRVATRYGTVELWRR